MSPISTLFTLLEDNWLNSIKSSGFAVVGVSLREIQLFTPVNSRSISGFDVLFAIVAIPRPGLTLDTVPALAVVLTVTLPVPPLSVIFPPARACVTPVLVTVTLPVGAFTDIAVPAITLSTEEPILPGIFNVTAEFAATAVTLPL